MKTFEVTMDIWRESFNGNDYCDDMIHSTVQARNAQSAIKKAKQALLTPPKGTKWSQSIWSKNERAIEISPKTP